MFMKLDFVFPLEISSSLSRDWLAIKVIDPWPLISLETY